ncbi:MAG TPA: L,D-transpeptidase [Gemmatimonadaceae bacterium]|nr:L,D-transpeptidase [Gemmatimonadaceae bacterium]
MLRSFFPEVGLKVAALSLFLFACVQGDSGETPVDTSAAAAVTPIPPPPPPPVTADMSIEVDVKARRLHVLKAGQRTASHPVAVGSTQWPTRTGEWTITQVVWNPDWNPPDESWAEEREPRESGDPKNPMGRAQLVYDPPRSIHGTNDPSSIGKAVSHGSIRLSNDVIVKLAQEVMEAAGAAKDSAWYRETQRNRTQKQVVDLPKVVPIRVF